ncbi:MAG: PfkB family carbohydrate kinase [Candidatus Bipolaricaulia bacterium]
MPRYDLVTFGETMLRLSPPDFKRLEQAESLNVTIGGSELNVAVAAQRLGLKTAYVTRLPRNPLGKLIANKAREHGVDTSHIVWTAGDRVGLYFVEFGANPRPSSVLYDRANSAISRIRPGEVDWQAIFQEARLFHTSGITPALSPSAAEATKEAVRAAKEAGIEVSLDLNYRAKLWSQEEARRCMTELMGYTDLLLTTEEDTERVFGIKGKDYAEVAKRLVEEFALKAVAITIREDISVWRNNWTAIVYAEGKLYDDITYELEIVDRVGAGDSFTAGFLYGYLTGDVEKGLKYGNALAALKHSIPGDLNWSTLEEVEALLRAGGKAGRIRR